MNTLIKIITREERGKKEKKSTSSAIDNNNDRGVSRENNWEVNLTSIEVVVREAVPDRREVYRGT